MNNTEILKELRSGTYYLATVDEHGFPQVRPFGSGVIVDDQICICTNEEKPVSKQMIANPNIQIATFANGYNWLRINATVKLVTSQLNAGEPLDKYRQAMFDDMPQLKELYAGSEHKMAVFALNGVKIVS